VLPVASAMTLPVSTAIIGSCRSLLLIVEIFVAECNREHALADQRHHLMLDQMRPLLVVEARCQSLHHPDRQIRRTQQNCAGNGRDRPPSNAAPTSRPSTANPNLLHSIGGLCELIEAQ
jgi:hypothetical protein